MALASLPERGFGFSWALPHGSELITKTVAPTFMFVDYETFVNTNIRHRLNKRMVDAYVSIDAPLWLLASVYGWDSVQDIFRNAGEAAGALDRACDHVIRCMEGARDAGADAIILCDDLCGAHGPVLDPRFVVEYLMPLYLRFAKVADSLGTQLIFHSDGDIREYYPRLAADGFAGVHVAHPAYEQTAELFAAAWEHGLLPLGGLVTARVESDGPAELAAFAARLAKEGPALICDDGAVSSREEFESILEAMQLCRASVEGGS